MRRVPSRRPPEVEPSSRDGVPGLSALSSEPKGPDTSESADGLLGLDLDAAAAFGTG